MRRLLLACLLAAASLAAAPVTTAFLVNTSSLASTTGFLEFQFLPTSTGADPATAVIDFWSTDAALAPSADPSSSGYTGGPLPASVTITNALAFNNYLHAVTAFGNFIRFQVTINVPVVSPASADSTTFGFFLWNDALDTALLNPTSPDGSLVSITVNNLGEVLAPQLGSPDVTQVPEPATMALAGAGLLVVAISRLKRRVR
jgi:hypothetical protein